jgi:hypothetical protein
MRSSGRPRAKTCPGVAKNVLGLLAVKSCGRRSVVSALLVSLLLSTLLSCQSSRPPASIRTPTPAATVPRLADPSRFEIKLFANLAALGRLKAFQLTLSDGEQGFPRGLYVTSGPAKDDRSDRLVRIDRQGKPSVVGRGFLSNETMVFAHGAYGNGLLVTEPLARRIVRLLPDGKRENFAVVGTEPFGPAGLFFNKDKQLLVADFSGNSVLRVLPDGKTKPLAHLPIPPAKAEYVDGPKGGFAGGFGGGGFGGGGAGRDYLFSTYTDGPKPNGQGKIYEISSTGDVQSIIKTGLDGLELIARSPGGKYGAGVFVPSAGNGEMNADGGLYFLNQQKKLSPLLTGLDAVSVVFDTHNIMRVIQGFEMLRGVYLSQRRVATKDGLFAKGLSYHT